MKKSIQITVGLVISAFCLWFTFRGFDLAELFAQAKAFRLAWSLPALGLIIAAFGLRILRWQWILASLQPLKFWTVGPALLFGFLMNSVLPARGGELARAYAISKRSTIPLSAAIGSVVVERTLDLFGLIAIMILASRLLPWSSLPVLPILGIAAALTAAMLIATLVLPRLPMGKTAMAQKVISFLAQIGAGFSVIRKPSKVIGLVLLSVIIWMADAATVAVLSRVALDLTFTQAAALNCGIAVGVMIPGAPGYVGTYEFFGKQALVFLGFPATTSLTFIVFLHFFQLAFIFASGIPAMLALGMRPGEVKKA